MTNKGNQNKPRGRSEQQRAQRLQQVLFGGLAVIMIISMLISLIR